MRGAFVATFNLPESVSIVTAGAIGLAVDGGRLATDGWEGAELNSRRFRGLLLSVPMSFVAAILRDRYSRELTAKRLANEVRLPAAWEDQRTLLEVG